jgi:hypothetical protein
MEASLIAIGSAMVVTGLGILNYGMYLRICELEKVVFEYKRMKKRTQKRESSPAASIPDSNDWIN